MGSRPTCSIVGCGTHAQGKSGLCKRCYNAAWDAANRDRKKARRKHNGNDRTRGARLTTHRGMLLALSLGRRNAKINAQIMSFLGMTAPQPARDIPSILILLEELARPIELRHVNVDYVRYWGGVLFSTDETYLELVGLLLKTKEPWKLFCDFANALTRVLTCDASERVRRSETMNAAAQYFYNARSQFWHVSYMLCKRTLGYNTAEGVFGPKPGPVDEVFANIIH
jgi:hypothetical protein